MLLTASTAPAIGLSSGGIGLMRRGRWLSLWSSAEVLERRLELVDFERWNGALITRGTALASEQPARSTAGICLAMDMVAGDSEMSRGTVTTL